MITLHIDSLQQEQIVRALRNLADDYEVCPERDDPIIVGHIDDLRDMADLIEDAEDA